jgi:tetratricopeptide (TPR) repeat protein
MMEKLQVNHKRYEKKIPGELDLRKVKVSIYKTGRVLKPSSTAKRFSPSVQILLLVVLVLSWTVSIFAQEELWNEPNTEIRTLYQQERYPEAAKVAEEALTVAENTFGPKDHRLGTSLNNLALLYKSQGRYAGAEPLYKSSLAISEKTLGPEHPDAATVCENMAELCPQIGKEDEAEAPEARARRIRSNQ